MPLATLESVRALLRCPRCRGPLRDDAGALRCVNPACGLAGRAFPRAGGQPALIDFERSVIVESELVARSGASAVARPTGGGATGVLQRTSSSPNRAAESRAQEMVTRLTAPDRVGKAARVLVVGGGTRGNGTGPLYDTPGVEVVAFDVYASPLTQFVADAHQIPLADASVDAVWVQAVLEHVLEPALVVAEIERVLVPGGLVYAETPFLQHVHEGPWDFTRFTESGHRWLFRSFERIDSGVVAGPATVWVWATEMLVRGLTRSSTLGRVARVAFSWVYALDRAVPREYSVDGASCVYFFGRRGDARLTPAGAIRGYAGAQRLAAPSAPAPSTLTEEMPVGRPVGDRDLREGVE